MSSKLVLTATLVVLLSAFIAIYNNIGYPSPGQEIIRQYQTIPIEGAIGPESYAFDPLGEGPYTGISDGRIIKWLQHEHRWVNFAVTSPNRGGCEGPHDHVLTEKICGRALGIRFNETSGDLYIADAYMGLLVVGPQGGVATKVATQAQGIPFRFTNSLDIDASGRSLYFTDSSSDYDRRNYMAVILSGDRTGRLMKYDPETKQVETLQAKLSFPNGVSLSKDGNSILISETTNCRVLKYWLSTEKAGNLESFADNLPGFPDNIKRSERGGYWVGIHSRNEGVFKLVLTYPWIGKALLKLFPLEVLMKVYGVLGKVRGSKGMGVRLSEEGEVVEMVEDRGGWKWRSVAEVEERDGFLWIGSIHLPSVGKLER